MSAAARPTRAAAIALLATCLSASADAQSGRAWRPEDRDLITWSGDLADVSLGPRRVYALSPFGVLVYDRAAQAWAPPLTLAAGFPAHERPSALAYDRVRDGLWVGTQAGGIWFLSGFSDRWESHTRVPGSVTALATVLAEGALYILARSSWYRLEGGGFSAQPVSPGEVPAEAAQRPEDDRRLAAGLGTLGLDPNGRRWRVSAVARGDHPGDYWVATGGGLVRYRADRMAGEWLITGLPSIGAGAVARIDGRIWIGSDRGRPLGGIAVADSALREWTRYDAEVADAPRGFVREIAGAGGAVWAAAEDGLFRIAVGDSRWSRVGIGEGMPTAASTALAVAGERIWVGTPQGLVLVTGDGGVGERLLPGTRVNRLAIARDTLWIASQQGLLIVPSATSPAGHTALRAPQAESAIARGAVLDVRVAGDTIWALTELGLRRHAGGQWSGPVGDARIGRPHRLALAPGALWVAGDVGAARLDLASGQWLTFVAPVDLPAGPVTDVVPWGDDVWLATPAGAVRLRWRE